VPGHDDANGPFVVLATLCERVTQRPDGQLNIAGVLQRLTRKQVSPHAEPPFPFEHQCQYIVALAAGAVLDTYHLRLEMETPDARSVVLFRDEVRFQGGARTRAFFGPISLLLETAGLYWFDVFVGSRRLTQFPY